MSDLQTELDQMTARVARLEGELERTDELLRPLAGQTRWQEFLPSEAPKLFESGDGHYVRCAVNRVIEDGYFRDQARGYDCSHMVNPVLNRTPAQSLSAIKADVLEEFVADLKHESYLHKETYDFAVKRVAALREGKDDE